MEVLDFNCIDQDKLVNDFDYFLLVYNLVEKTGKVPQEIESKYNQGFWKFADNLPIMNQQIPRWNPNAQPIKSGLLGMLQRFSDFFS
jgi:hypothetical protein